MVPKRSTSLHTWSGRRYFATLVPKGSINLYSCPGDNFVALVQKESRPYLANLVPIESYSLPFMLRAKTYIVLVAV